MIDFGISDEIGGHTTHILRETMIGSLHYMSPESSQPDSGKQTLSRASDVWSLGIILYRIVFGRLHVAASSASRKKGASKNPSMMDMVRFLTQQVDPKSLAEEPVQIPTVDRIQGPAERIEMLRDFIAQCVRWSPTARAKTSDLLAHPLLERARLDCFKDGDTLRVGEDGDQFPTQSSLKPENSQSLSQGSQKKISPRSSERCVLARGLRRHRNVV